MTKPLLMMPSYRHNRHSGNQCKMDPWQPHTESANSLKDCPSECASKFADSFVDINDLEKASGEPADPPRKLADTDRYINKLYGKLSRLQQAPSSRQLVSSLQTGREDQLARLLSADRPASTPDPVPTDPVTTGYLQRRLLPHTVPLSSDELLQLLQADQLQRLTDQQEDKGDQGS